ncbi:hypothetical protein ACOSQ4_008778 [Xanthoceras sorbifolium]
MKSRTKRQSAQLFENVIEVLLRIEFELICVKAGFGKSEKQTVLCRIFVKSIRVEQQLNPEYQKWKKSDQILLFWLISTLSQKLVEQVTKCKSSLEAWTKLQNLYSQKSMAKILNLSQQLQTITKGSHSVSDFVLKIKNIGDALSTAGEEVSERDLLLSLMHGVGYKYDAVVVLISSQRSTISLEEAQVLLLIHEQRIEELNSLNSFG